MHRRLCLQGLGAAVGAAALGKPSRAAIHDDPPALPERLQLAAAWRGPRPSDPHHVGVLAVDWTTRQVAIVWSSPLPTRPHGLTPEPGGGLLVTGVRPGTWLARFDARGDRSDWVSMDDETGSSRLNGHVAIADDGQRLYTTETDPVTGRGRIGVRDARTLRRIASWDSLGIEPHQVICDGEGRVWVANGGVPRTASDHKHSLDRMDSSLVRLDPNDGRASGQWRLDDPRLSLRHLAWSVDTPRPFSRLGIAMQAEHEDDARRQQAPVLAVWEDEALRVPLGQTDHGSGYAGDLCAVSGGGFVVSNNRAGAAWRWSPESADRLTTIATLREAYALATAEGGALIASAYGIARWHPFAPPVMAAWPQPMALDNHWVRIDRA